MANFYLLPFGKWQKQKEIKKKKKKKNKNNKTTKQQRKKRTTKTILHKTKTRVSAYIHTHENTK